MTHETHLPRGGGGGGIPSEARSAENNVRNIRRRRHSVPYCTVLCCTVYGGGGTLYSTVQCSILPHWPEFPLPRPHSECPDVLLYRARLSPSPPSASLRVPRRLAVQCPLLGALGRINDIQCVV